MNIKKITVLYNFVEEVKTGIETDKLAESYNLKAAEDVSKALRKLGYEVILFDVNTKTLKLLQTLKTDLIFNLLEGFDDIPNTFPQITKYIESLNTPITGSNSFAASITTDKSRTKDFLIKNKIPTPNYQLFISGDEPLKYSLRYPLITKPNSSDASMGITQDSVVKNFSELRDRILFIKENYRDATLAEEYIDGRELDVYSVNAGEDIVIFPILEGLFLLDVNRKWNICDFDHKWGPKSYCDEECPAKLSNEVHEHIYQIVRDVHRIFDIKGYMRLDIRLYNNSIPYILEINTNPGLELGEGKDNIPNIAAKGVTYEQFIQMIIDATIYEYEDKPSIQKSFSQRSNLVKS